MAGNIPPIGLGVYQAGEAVYDAVRYALSDTDMWTAPRFMKTRHR